MNVHDKDKEEHLTLSPEVPIPPAKPMKLWKALIILFVAFIIFPVLRAVYGFYNSEVRALFGLPPRDY